MSNSDYKKKSDRIIKASQAGTIILTEFEQAIIAKQQRGDRLTASDMITIEELIEKLEEGKS